jgi:AP-2 complex subunit alpha
VKLLRLLQYYPSPVSSDLVPTVQRLMRSLLDYALTHPKNYNQANAVHSVVVETINFIIHLDPYSEFLKECCKILGQFLESKDTNMRYLALETMSHIAASGDPLKTLPVYQQTVLRALSDKDISIRRRALDVLYSMCSPDNCRDIVHELLNYLCESDYEFQEELVLKTAILAEKFVSEYTWYVDVILKLITTAGDAASDSLCFRVVQIVTNNPDLREYAAYTILQAVKEPNCHEVTVKIAGHILGEFGHVIVESPGCSPLEQYMALYSKFGMFSNTTRAILLNTYLKFCNLFPEIKKEIIKLMEIYTYALDPELQQRAWEYLVIVKDESMLATICEEMPVFPDRESSLLSQLTKKINDTEDVRTWVIGGIDAQEELIKKRELIPEHNDNIGFPSDTSQSPGSVHSGLPVLSPVQTNIQTEPFLIGHLHKRLIGNKNGILYEDSILQVGFKSDFQAQLGRIAFFFGNKSKQPLSQFRIETQTNESLVLNAVDQIHAIIPANTQLHQIFNVELFRLPIALPKIRIFFVFNGKLMNIQLSIPVTVNKFMTGVSMEAVDYMNRWKLLTNEMQQIIKLKDTTIPVSFADLGFTKIENIDPNPLKGTFASILSCTEVGKIGMLLRLEISKDNTILRLTYRSTNEIALQSIQNVMAEYFE